MRHQLASYSPLALRDVLEVFSTAAARDELTSALLREYRASGATLYGSGTQALGEAIRLGGPEGVVALPAFGCFDLATAAVAAGLRVRLYDLDPVTLSPDPASFDEAIRRGTTVAVVAPLYGVPVAWDRLAAIADETGCLLIEDAAQAHGASWRNRPLGSWGRVSIISFGRGKGWTCGGGGALLVRDGIPTPPPPPVAGDRWRRAALLAAQWALGRPSLYGIPASVPALGLGETMYRPPRSLTGLPDHAARILLHSLTAAQLEAEHRRRNAEFLLGLVQGEHTVSLPTDAVPGWLRLPLRVPGTARSALLERTGRRLGIAPSYPAPLPTVPALQPLLAEPGRRYPGAEVLTRELLTLPTHSRLTRRDLDHICSLLARHGLTR